MTSHTTDYFFPCSPKGSGLFLGILRATDKKAEMYSVVRLFQISVAFTSLLTKITGERHDVDLHLLSPCNPLTYGNQLHQPMHVRVYGHSPCVFYVVRCY